MLCTLYRIKLTKKVLLELHFATLRIINNSSCYSQSLLYHVKYKYSFMKYKFRIKLIKIFIMHTTGQIPLLETKSSPAQLYTYSKYSQILQKIAFNSFCRALQFIYIQNIVIYAFAQMFPYISNDF